MAIFGRETKREQDRAVQVRDWIYARSRYALLSACAGAWTVVDSPIMVLTIPFGIAAVVLGVLGLREIKTNPQLLGKRLCYAGIALAVIGWIAAVLIWRFVYQGG